MLWRYDIHCIHVHVLQQKCQTIFKTATILILLLHFDVLWRSCYTELNESLNVCQFIKNMEWSAVILYFAPISYIKVDSSGMLEEIWVPRENHLPWASNLTYFFMLGSAWMWFKPRELEVLWSLSMHLSPLRTLKNMSYNNP